MIFITRLSILQHRLYCYTFPQPINQYVKTVDIEFLTLNHVKTVNLISLSKSNLVSSFDL